MIPFIKRFSYLHLKNLDDLQPDETEVKGIVPSPRYNLRARAVRSSACYLVKGFFCCWSANGVENDSSIRFENVGRAFVRNPPQQKSRIKAGHGNGVKSNSGYSGEFFLVGPPQRSLALRVEP
ncbi:hypothetical protein TNCV_3722541 [Trichonephila clavipes]|nr:hypothetical protein TNCV_3722541 [Trichonephila clavipes]